MILLESRAPRAVSADAAWSEISRDRLPYWNDVLFRTGAPVHQYPFWNQPYESLYFSPRYLVWGRHNDAKAFVCILTVGFRGFRIGLVFRGPVNLKNSGPVPPEALSALRDWAGHEGYVFLRLTPQEGDTFNATAGVQGAREGDFFPFYLDCGRKCPELAVEQKESDDATLASFDREARRKLRRAMETGCETRSSESVQALVEAWPLDLHCTQRKGFRLERPLAFYADLMRGASCHDAARVYTAWHQNKLWAMTLVVRDRDAAHCLLAAYADDASNSGIPTLLHWTSMRHMFRMGARFYNMGCAPGSLARFKNQFSPISIQLPGAVSLVADEKRFKLWTAAVLPLAQAIRPRLRKLSGRFYQRSARVRAGKPVEVIGANEQAPQVVRQIA